jgi:hypothetical protein
MAKGPIEIIDNAELVEPVSGNRDFKQELKKEAFMEEVVTVMIHPTTNENEPPYAHLNVNGLNQVIPRGQDVPVRRKFVEVLARMKETRYTQSTPNPSEPDRIVMSARHGLAFPFVVTEDKNPKGRAWLANILAEAG